VVKLSAQRTGRIYASVDIPGIFFSYSLSRSQGHIEDGKFKSIKHLIHHIGKRTRDLPACIAVPQTAEYS